jgi:hypothetical protein
MVKCMQEDKNRIREFILTDMVSHIIFLNLSLTHTYHLYTEHSLYH